MKYFLLKQNVHNYIDRLNNLDIQVRNAMNAQMVKLDQELAEARTSKEELSQYKVGTILYVSFQLFLN
jgi:hypothetical protein